MKLAIPELSLVVLIGPSGSGKSTFSRDQFRPTEVLSSDFCRGLVADDENDQSASADAFDVLHYVAAKRLAAGRMTVIDATNVQAASRRPLVALARQYHVLPVAIVFNLPEKLCKERNAGWADRQFGPHVIRDHLRDLHRSLAGLREEGFRTIHVFRSADEVAAATIVREPLYTNRKADTGPFDIIGDVHGCADELRTLLGQLGYSEVDGVYRHPNRRAIFLGDLVDRGLDSPGVLRIVMGMVAAGAALAVPGNHDIKLLKRLQGRDVTVSHGLAETLEPLAAEPEAFRSEVAAFLDGLISHYVLDGGRLVVAHAGLKEWMQGRGSGRVRDFCLYGETTGETDNFGLPVRGKWAAEYRGSALVVYGHTPVAIPDSLNNTLNIDTGCVFGGALTALRYPEREIVSVPAAREYYAPSRPSTVPASTAMTTCSTWPT